MPTPTKGMTLIELMVALAVAGVLIPMSIPAFTRLFESYRTSATTHLVFTGVVMARTHAVMTGSRTVLCPVDDDERCVRTPDWSTGMLVFEDANGNGQHERDERVITGVPREELGPLRLLSTRGRPRIGYRADGRSSGSNLSLRLCTPDSRLLRRIVISVGGRPRIEMAKPGASCDSI